MKAIQIFFNTGERIYPDEARAMTARLFNGEQSALLDTVMNYAAGEKVSRQGFPVVQFAGSTNGFSINGFGEMGVAAARDVAPLIHKKMAKETNKVITLTQRVVDLSVEYRPYGIEYTVPRMVVQKHPRHLESMRDPVKGAEHLENLFLNSLKRQAEALGIELPSNLKATYKSSTGTFNVKPSKGSKVALLGLRNATFELNARLSGIWACGFLMSKGYGNFNADLQLGTMGG